MQVTIVEATANQKNVIQSIIDGVMFEQADIFAGESGAQLLADLLCKAYSAGLAEGKEQAVELKEQKPVLLKSPKEIAELRRIREIAGIPHKDNYV